MSNTATRSDIVVNQGARFQLNVAVKNSDGTVKDLTGYSARMQVRATKASSTVLMEATTGLGTISINAPGGIVSVNIGASATAAMTWNAGYYDMEIFTVDPNEVIRVVEGFATLSKEVTR